MRCIFVALLVVLSTVCFSYEVDNTYVAEDVEIDVVNVYSSTPSELLAILGGSNNKNSSFNQTNNSSQNYTGFSIGSLNFY